MAHIFLPGGQTLRLRLFPKAKLARKRPANITSLALFDPPVEDDSNDSPAERLAVRLASLALFNRVNAAILERAANLGLRDWWLVSRSIFETVWNLKSGRAADQGIEHYDLFYFSEDMSEEAEADVILAARRLFKDLNAVVRVRNQARVHLWYPDLVGVAYPPLTTAAEGIMRFPCSPQAVGLKRSGEEFIDVYAPFGLGDIWDMIVRPNRALPLAAVYGEKAVAWRNRWPQLQVFPWDGDARPKLHAVRSLPP